MIKKMTLKKCKILLDLVEQEPWQHCILHRWAQIHLLVSSFLFQNDRLEPSLQTTTFSNLLVTKKRERPEVFKYEERCNRSI
jgi:hypothetical protein